MCLCLYLRTHSPCYKHFLKHLRDMPQIHYCAHICALRLEKSQTYPDFIIIYCYLKNFWIARHIRAKRRRVKSSSARLRDGEFEGQCCSRKILQHCCLFIAKLSHNCGAQPESFRGMDPYKNQQARARNPSRGRSDLRPEPRHGTGKHPR